MACKGGCSTAGGFEVAQIPTTTPSYRYRGAIRMPQAATKAAGNIISIGSKGTPPIASELPAQARIGYDPHNPVKISDRFQTPEQYQAAIENGVQQATTGKVAGLTFKQVAIAAVVVGGILYLQSKAR
jgi:hypothetical protein